MISCSYCNQELSADEETAYFQGQIYHPKCLGELLEEEDIQ